MSKKIIAPIAAGVLLAMAGAAQAATKTSSFNVTASVAKNCIINTANLNLGVFDGTSDLTASSNILVRCTNLTAYSVALSPGSGVFGNRTMVSGTNSLIYNLYTDNTYGTVWGDGTGTTSVVSGAGSGMGIAGEKTHTVFGRLLASANAGGVDAGAYSDTITATITY
jgi:spore coat protein U-like protein